MRARRPSSSRFCQLFACCTILLIVPTLLFLSSSQSGPKLVRDPRTGQWYTTDSLKAGTGKGDDLLIPVGGKGINPALSQGNGAAPIPADAAQGWRLPGALSHIDDVLKDSWGGLKDGVNALGENVNAALGTGGGGAKGGAGVIPPGAVELKAPIMDKLTNETLRAELGRATWKFLHTMTLRFPETPTQDERDTLKTFIYSFSRLYPCAECAGHFQELLKELPPQTSSRKAASMWLCSVHNRVNARLGKEQFDCLKLDETYDCGCGGDEGGAGSKKNGTAGAGKGTSPVPPAGLGPPAKLKQGEVFEGLGAGPGPGSE